MKFEFIDDLTSDVMFRAYGKTLEEMFENAALALMSVMFNVKKVKAEKEVTVKSEGENEEDLLYNFLTELLITFETEQVMLSKFRVKIANGKLTAMSHGSESKDRLIQTHVKGITYHKFEVKKDKGKWVCQVVVDI